MQNQALKRMCWLLSSLQPTEKMHFIEIAIDLQRIYATRRGGPD